MITTPIQIARRALGCKLPRKHKYAPRTQATDANVKKTCLWISRNSKTCTKDDEQVKLGKLKYLTIDKNDKSQERENDEIFNRKIFLLRSVSSTSLLNTSACKLFIDITQKNS